MHDNGLLKYYRHKAYRDGFLSAKDFKLKEDISIENWHATTVRCKSPVGDFYKKFKHYFCKEMADAEILLSQLYKTAGLETALYFPVEENGHQFVVCNNVFTPETIEARAYHDRIAEEQGGNTIGISSFMSEPFSDKNPVVKYFYKKALAERVKTRVLDSASYNPDRQDCNYLYSLRNGRADGVVLFDYERSGLEASRIMHYGSELSFGGYANDFGFKNMSRLEAIDALKKDEFVHSVADLKEIGEEIGKIDVKGTALDITRTTGYCVEQKYVDMISRSFDQTADLLVK